jgi:MFS family permease
MNREAWFLSYGSLGLTQNGLVPILLPLAAEHGATAGLGYAAFALTGLLAPVLGGWADRFGRHRDLLVWGSAGAALCLLLFTVVGNAMLRLILDAGAGLGTMAATTAGNVLAIQGRPEQTEARNAEAAASLAHERVLYAARDVVFASAWRLLDQLREAEDVVTSLRNLLGSCRLIGPVGVPPMYLPSRF